MNAIIEKLNEFGAVTDGNFYGKIGSDELYIASLDAFALDDCPEMLCNAVTKQDFKIAYKLCSSLLKSAEEFDLPPLVNITFSLSEALKNENITEINECMSKFKDIFNRFTAALNNN